MSDFHVLSNIFRLHRIQKIVRSFASKHLQNETCSSVVITVYGSSLSELFIIEVFYFGNCTQESTQPLSLNQETWSSPVCMLSEVSTKSLQIFLMIVFASAAIILRSMVRIQRQQGEKVSQSPREDTDFMLLREPRPALTRQPEILLVEME